ncbi:MAG: DUF3473 domain-containing protein [Nitrospirae bacterium]|nr:DUF3473 domain-containing protein [Magnetococcales bacterium]HAT51249.1 polysaccharide deacetylase family protein [Alphaproteobacteria bacterium]
MPVTPPSIPPIMNAFTVDVEDYFHVALFEKHVSCDRWSTMEHRVERNTDRILEMMAQRDIHATFFILGWIAERYPALVRRISDQGHEIASHGMHHIRVTLQSPEVFFQDVQECKHKLEDVCGQQVRGYRAATYSIGRDNLWALEILKKAGYQYSSSIYPIRHDLYGWPEAPRFAFYPQRDENQGDGLLEIPISTLEWFGRRIPCGGGGYFRLYPLPFSIWALRHLNKNEGESAVFYLHPWELDPGQPRLPGLPMKVRFRHYLNLEKMDARLQCLLDSLRWDRMDRVFAHRLEMENKR